MEAKKILVLRIISNLNQKTIRKIHSITPLIIKLLLKIQQQIRQSLKSRYHKNLQRINNFQKNLSQMNHPRLFEKDKA